MKILESSAKFYDFGISLLTMGKIKKIYTEICKFIEKGAVVLDIGCGTGNIAIMAAKKGAKVVGMDINPAMLEIARKKAKKERVEDNAKFVEKGIAELDDEPNEAYDVVVSSLCFSELSIDEQRYAFEHISRILTKEGTFILADEMLPKNIFKRIIYYILKSIVAIITLVLTQQSTKPLKNIEKLLAENNLSVKTVYENWLGSLKVLLCTKVV